MNSVPSYAYITCDRAPWRPGRPPAVPPHTLQARTWGASTAGRGSAPWSGPPATSTGRSRQGLRCRGTGCPRAPSASVHSWWWQQKTSLQAWELGINSSVLIMTVNLTTSWQYNTPRLTRSWGQWKCICALEYFDIMIEEHIPGGPKKPEQ